MTGLIRFYGKNVNSYGADVKSVAWGSKESQEKRFEILSGIADLSGKYVLDVGCGMGDFYGWLRDRYTGIRYMGVDITPAMIRTAIGIYPKTKFKVMNILEMDDARPTYDYVFASGIFNRRIPGHRHFVADVIRRMFTLSKLGMAFNIMSTKADFMEKKEYYADPGRLLSFCLNMSRKVVLRHDYMSHDFTVYVYK